MGTLHIIGNTKCGHCNELIKDHSKKNSMRCLYTSNYNLYRAIKHIQHLESLLKDKEVPHTYKSGDYTFDVCLFPSGDVCATCESANLEISGKNWEECKANIEQVVSGVQKQNI